MRIAVAAESLITGKICEVEGAEAAAVVLRDECPEKLLAMTGELGMKREGECIVRVEGEAPEALAALAVRGYFHGAYRFAKRALQSLNGNVFRLRDSLCDYGFGTLVIDCDADVREAVARALVLARCEGYARMLGNLPNNYLHTAEMAAYLADMAADCGLGVRVLGGEALSDMGCGGILCVNQGSSAEAKLVVLERRADGEAPVALVGKGVMFDAGGYHLKSLDGMNGMKFDMCGAASVAEVMEYLARSAADASVIAYLPLVENVISPDAVKMGDVVSTLSGKTVEIYNTDAEGRMILCDALTMAQNEGAKTVIDLATLTYGAHGALGDEVGAYFANRDALADRFADAAAASGEPFWRLPLGERYHEALKWSEVADLGNYAPGYGAAASTAACFLEEFIEADVSWLHLDVVGPSSRRGGAKWECKGARGVAVNALAALLER